MACFSETRILTFSKFLVVVNLFKYSFSLLLFKILATDIQTLLSKCIPLSSRITQAQSTISGTGILIFLLELRFLHPYLGKQLLKGMSFLKIKWAQAWKKSFWE